MIFHDLARSSAIFHDLPRSSTIFQDVPRSSTIFHDVPRSSTMFHDLNDPPYVSITRFVFAVCEASILTWTTSCRLGNYLVVWQPCTAQHSAASDVRSLGHIRVVGSGEAPLSRRHCISKYGQLHLQIRDPFGTDAARSEQSATQFLQIRAQNCK